MVSHEGEHQYVPRHYKSERQQIILPATPVLHVVAVEQHDRSSRNAHDGEVCTYSQQI